MDPISVCLVRLRTGWITVDLKVNLNYSEDNIKIYRVVHSYVLTVKSCGNKKKREKDSVLIMTCASTYKFTENCDSSDYTPLISKCSLQILQILQCIAAISEDGISGRPGQF